MLLRPLNREQSWLLPLTPIDLLPDKHKARIVAEFVDALDRSSSVGREFDLDGDPIWAAADEWNNPDSYRGIVPESVRKLFDQQIDNDYNSR